MYCPRVREGVSRPGRGRGDLNIVIYNFVEGCGLFNNMSSFKGWSFKGNNYIYWISVPYVII